MSIALALAFALSAAQQDGGQAGKSIPYTKPYLCNFAKVYHIKVGSYLSVRSGPGVEFSKVDQLAAGASVYICDERGEWFRIFYGGADSPCGSISPSGLDVRKVTTCKSDWVNRKWINVLSG